MSGRFRLDRESTELTCRLIHTVFPSSPQLANLVPLEEILETPLHHYSACPARKVRDCVVLAHTRNLLENYKRLLLHPA